MRDLEAYRDALKGLMDKALNKNGFVKYIFGKQMLFSQMNNDLIILPQVLDPAPVQDMDPESDTFGEFYYALDAAPLDSLAIR